ncbi:hypothetical protein OEZ86_005091 [Tetradesmus obliquus]|nr:hypothetical protein OEZ86_005091 [Tetradesmus obliquus]
MDDNGKRKDLRAQVLEEEAKRHCQGVHGGAGLLAGQQQDSRHATDFTGFYQELNMQKPSEQQQQHQDQHHSAGTNRYQCQQQQQQQHGPGHGVDQLLSQHSLQTATAGAQLHAIVNIDRQFAPDASRDGCMRVPPAAGSSGAHAAAAAQERWHLQGLQQLPWDWSVKQRVRLSSAAAFAVLEEQRTSGLGPVCDAIAAGGQCKDASGLSSQERLCRALLQHQHPAAQLSAASLAALRSGEDSILAARVSAWREALRGAYSSLRHGHCPVLYVSGQAFRQQFTAVLCAPGVLGCQQLHALVGRSNKLMRQHLAAHGCTGQLAGLLEQQQQQQQQAQGRQLGATAFDGQPGSQLLVVGAQQVHGLYAALLALSWCGAEQPDVPLLLAPTQFLHSAVCPLRLEVMVVGRLT